MIDDELERRLAARMREWRSSKQLAWERSVAAHSAAFDRWKADRRSKLEGMHPTVRLEVESSAWTRIKDGKDVNLTTADIRECESRVVSRLRLKAYGGMPADPDEFERQQNEIRQRVGLSPVYRPPVQMAAE